LQDTYRNTEAASAIPCNCTAEHRPNLIAQAPNLLQTPPNAAPAPLGRPNHRPLFLVSTLQRAAPALSPPVPPSSPGRNIHALDPYRMPGIAAQERGAAAGAAILQVRGGRRLGGRWQGGCAPLSYSVPFGRDHHANLARHTHMCVRTQAHTLSHSIMHTLTYSNIQLTTHTHTLHNFHTQPTNQPHPNAPH
jgi:hypothetical protein